MNPWKRGSAPKLAMNPELCGSGRPGLAVLPESLCAGLHSCESPVGASPPSGGLRAVSPEVTNGIPPSLFYSISLVHKDVCKIGDNGSTWVVGEWKRRK